MKELLRVVVVDLIVIFVYTNFHYLESAFVKGRVKIDKQFPKAIYGIIIPINFLILPMTVLSLVATMSLQIIYVMRVSEKVEKAIEAEVALKKANNLSYYTSVYWDFFAKPSMIVFLVLVPAIVFVFLSTKF